MHTLGGGRKREICERVNDAHIKERKREREGGI